MSNHAGYLFLPYFRTGLASYLTEQPSLTDLAAGERAKLDARLILETFDLDGNKGSVEIPKTIALYGPGDVACFDVNAIKMHDPVNDVGDFEPNYFPSVEFWDLDYPWRYTPFGADGDGKLMPWLALIVLVAEDTPELSAEFEQVGAGAAADQANKQQLPLIRNVSVQSLPDLNESWRWAHVQILTEEPSTTGIKDDEIRALLESNPERITSRLLCTRRLQPGVLYNAFIVPTFRSGHVPAGVTEANATSDGSMLAWDSNGSDRVDLRYCFRWEFRTGERGDFEKLVTDLTPDVLTTEIGLREMDTSSPGYGFTGPGVLNLESALQTLETEYDQWGHDDDQSTWQAEDLQLSLASLLNRNADNVDLPEIVIPPNDSSTLLGHAGLVIRREWAEINFETSTPSICAVRFGDTSQLPLFEDDQPNDDQTLHQFKLFDLVDGNIYRLKIVAKIGNTWEPISTTISFQYHAGTLVTPPLYGQWHADKVRVSTKFDDADWFQRLNLDPRHRTPAGIGAEVVRKEQEALMASAWEQAGDIDFVNAIIKRAQLGIQVSKNIYARLQGLSQQDFLLQSRALHKRTKVSLDSGNVTVAAHIDRSRIPKAAVDPAFRRIIRRFGPTKKQMAKGKFVEGAHILDRFNDLDNPFRPAGPHPTPAGAVNLCKDLNNLKTEYSNRPMDFPDSDDDQPPGFPTDVEGIFDNDHNFGIGDMSNPSFCSEDLLLSFDRFRQEEYEGVEEAPAIRPDSTPEEKQVALVFAILKLLWQDAEPPLGPTLDIDQVYQKMIDALDPAITIADRVRHLVNAPDGYLQTIETVMPAPKFPQSMYAHLRDISKELICAGISNIKPDSVAILATNTRFIEAFMCGLNHEMARELLWREYPTDQRGTYFRQFWDPIRSIEVEDLAREHLNVDLGPELLEETVTEILEDIRPIDQWGENDLGDNPSNLAYLLGQNQNESACEKSEKIVMVIRGNLLKKYPNTKIYIYKEASRYQGTQIETQKQVDDYFERLVATLNRSGSKEIPEGLIFEPQFRADIPADITCIGFNLRICDILKEEEKHYLVIEERVDRIRFGLDIDNTGESGADEDWDNLSWEHFCLKDSFGKYLDATSMAKNTNLPPAPIDQNEAYWNSHSANIAGITRQKPVRVVISLKEMIPASLLGQGNK